MISKHSKILGLDPGYHTGWACTQMTTGSCSVGRKDLPHNRKKYDRPYDAFRGWIDDILARWGVQYVAYENAHYWRAAKALNCLIGQLEDAVCARNAQIVELSLKVPVIQVAGVHPMTLKKFALGKANRPKAAMLDAALEKFRHRQLDQHQVDALWLVEYAKTEIDWEK